MSVYYREKTGAERQLERENVKLRRESVILERQWQKDVRRLQLNQEREAKREQKEREKLVKRLRREKEREIKKSLKEARKQWEKEIKVEEKRQAKLLEDLKWKGGLKRLRNNRQKLGNKLKKILRRADRIRPVHVSDAIRGTTSKWEIDGGGF